MKIVPDVTALDVAELPPHAHEYDRDSGCYLCRSKRPFGLPPRLVGESLAGRLVIFAGAGVSTEGRYVMPDTLYAEVAADVGADTSTASFPEVMSRFEAAEGRATLLQRIKSRIDYIDSFPQIQSLATRFHNELSTLFPVTEIVTTNWDIYFERICGATPIVVPDDYAFWTLPGRKVFKIHGSINNVGSIVATEEDYAACYERLRSGVIGASLKHMLATKTLVFFGYSFRDEDFNQIYRFLHDEMGRILPRSYIVTIDDSFDGGAYPASTVITTDGAYFLEVFKQHLLTTEHFLDDAHFDDIPLVLLRVHEAHDRVLDAFPAKKYPDVIYACAYQDGLIDAFQRILSRARTGEYSHVCDVQHKIVEYFEARRRNMKRRKYEDIAYIEGYKNGLVYLIADEATRDAFPLYFVFGAGDIETFSDFKRALRKAPTLHKTAHARAEKIVAPFQSSELVFQHPPFIDLSP